MVWKTLTIRSRSLQRAATWAVYKQNEYSYKGMRMHNIITPTYADARAHTL